MAALSRFTAFGFGWRRHGAFTPSTPTLPLAGVEVLYPIQPSAKANTRSYRTDSRAYRSVQKSASEWRREYCDIGFRVRAANAAAFLSFIASHIGEAVTLLIPGVQPFIRANESNSVYIVGASAPSREYQFYWRINVTFMRSP